VDAISDTVSVMTYTNWDTGQPNNHHGVLESCMYLTTYYSFEWHDTPCNSEKCPVCEIDI